MEQHYVTKEKLKELQEELEKLKNETRAKIAKRLKRAKEHGDLSENSEYLEAREAQQKAEIRINQLDDAIKNAKVIEHTKSDIVEVGSTIEISRDGTKRMFTIVGPDDSNPEKGLISNASPLGEAFLGKKAGDSVDVRIPSGKATYKIESVK